MYQLYSLPGTCSTGVLALLNKLGLETEVIHRNAVENYQALVPTNQVPALKDGERLLTEGAAIVLHLLEKHGDPLAGSWQQEEFKQWLMFNYATLHPAYGKMFAIMRLMEEGEVKEKLQQQLADKTAETWKIIDDRLAKQTFVVGDSATVMDYLIAIYVSWGNFLSNVDIPVGENVLRLAKQVSQLPEFKAAFEMEGAEFSIPENAYHKDFSDNKLSA